MNTIKTYFASSFMRNLIFWICVFLYYMLSSNIEHYEGGYIQLFHSTLKIIIPQFFTALICLNILVPRFLNKKKTLQFILWLILVLIAAYLMYFSINVFFYEPKYLEYFSDFSKEYSKTPFFKRVLNFSVFLSKSIKFLTPTAILLMARFYRNQQQFLMLREQKKIAELDALKNQLNPHFLFNTLNNLYSLALEKSDKTPEVIERLSDMLDYMLYRCNDKFVSIQKEIELIENYLALEKIRYGKRVEISFSNEITKEVNIAPLLLLTFIENAFKHGVSQALKNARINISLGQEKGYIVFSIYNTKPGIAAENGPTKKEMLGLKNIKKQLELLYPNSYDLRIKDMEDSYSVELKIIER